MGTYATSADVTRNIPGRSIGETTTPSTTDIDAWISQAEAMLTGALVAGGVSTPITNANGILIMEAWAVLYAEGHARMTVAAGLGDGANDDGKDLIEQFNKVLDDIRADPAGIEAMLSGGATSDTTRKVKAYVLDNNDGLTVTDGDFAPMFSTTMPGDADEVL